MAIIVKLTYTQTGCSTLVNLEMMKTAYRMFEKEKQVRATRINFNSNDFIIVDESLQTIMESIEQAQKGIQQDFILNDSDAEDNSIETVLLKDFKRNVLNTNKI